VGEDSERASAISSLERGTGEGFHLSQFLLGMVPLEGKKWSSNALLRETGSEASGNQGNLGVFRMVTSFLAVQMLLGEVLVKKLAQYERLVS